MATLIDDGYSRDGYIAAATPEPNGERIHEAVRFKYRVATRRDLIRHEAEVKASLVPDTVDAKFKAEDLACKFVADRVPEWDVTTTKGAPAPITPDSLLKIHPLVFGAMYSIVRGWRTSDPKPEEPQKPEPTDAEMVGNSETVSG